jgi:hypothetical protein
MDWRLLASATSASTTQTTELTGVGVTISASPLAMFIAGAVTVTLLGLGFGLLSRGMRRRMSARKELHQLRKGQANAAATSTPPATPERSGSSNERRGDEGRSDEVRRDEARRDEAQHEPQHEPRHGTHNPGSDTDFSKSQPLHRDPGSRPTSPG